MHRLPLTFFTLLFFSQSAWAVPELLDLQLQSSESQSIAFLELSSATEHSVFTLSAPDRVVVDVKATPGNDLDTSPLAAGAVRAVRTGRPSADTLRVVFDLDRPGRPSSFVRQHENGTSIEISLLSSDTPRAAELIVQPKRSRDIIIAIDPGHGGKDPGASGRSGTKEKDVVMAIAKKLAERINRAQGMRAVLTRDKDIFLSLSQRIVQARNENADMFVSIHADAFKDPRAKGSTVYILSERGASSEAARWIAEKENAADLVGGISIKDKDADIAQVLLDLSQQATIAASYDAGEHIIDELEQLGKVRRSDVQYAGFQVLKAPDIPSVLIETAFISNPTEEKKLKDINHQRKLSEAIYNGIYRYFRNRAPEGSYFAELADETYTVTRGDTLGAIAMRYETSVSELRRLNDLKSDSIQIGDVIKLPAFSSS